ncbi:exo-alpha-sialidase [Actinokineospora sp.]|uniref:exo-alpha-sialidase n=1 Tax=Actinokineospora sp. TaxID=1872133 RepID=UPI004037F8D5
MARLLVALLLILLITPPAAAAPGRTLLDDVGSSYPRVIRLADGTVLATIGSRIGGDSVGLVYRSTDSGRTFRRLAVIADPAGVAGAGMCCGTLFELPRRVGALPAGTLLWATTAGFDTPSDARRVRQRLWRSDDKGATWAYLSDIAVSPNEYTAWEPELSVAADGSLVAFYSDESDKAAHDQKLVQVRSRDGRTWSAPTETVTSADRLVRPGMIGVRRLPDGTYFMVYEVCNNDLLRLCGIYFRTSVDGWNYGDPTDLGTQVRTTAGRYPRHTPTVTVTPQGTLLLVSEMLVEPDGSLAAGNGRTILVNEAKGAGRWREIPAPVVVAGVNNEGCRNFSPSLLATADGVLELATDLDGGVCKTYYATGPVPRT